MFFGTVGQKISDGKTWYPPPSYPKIFSLPEFFWNTKGFSHEVFRYFQIKNIRRKTVRTPPLSNSKLFHTRSFLKHKRVPPRSFLALWKWDFPTENCETPLFCKKKLSKPQFFVNTEGYPHDVFRSMTQKNPTEKPDTLPDHDVSSIVFSIPQIIRNSKGSPTKTLGTVRLKTLDGKLWDPPLLIKTFFPYQRFPQTQKGSRTKFSGTMKLKFFDGKPWNHSILKKKFSEPQNFGNTKGFTHDLFQHCETKKSDGETCYPPPPPIHTFSHIRIFLKHKRVPPRCFLVLQDNNFPRKMVKTFRFA